MKMQYENEKLSCSSSPKPGGTTFRRFLFVSIFLSLVLIQAIMFVQYAGDHYAVKELYYEALMDAPITNKKHSVVVVGTARSPESKFESTPESVKKSDAVVSRFSDPLKLKAETDSKNKNKNEKTNHIASSASVSASAATATTTTNAMDNESNSSKTKEIEILLPPEEIAWMKERIGKFDAWHNSSLANAKAIRKMRINTQTYKPDADVEGPWLDFVIIGAPKCGTTSLVANLAAIAPMTTADHCKDPPMTVKHAYNDWPLQLNPHGNRTLRVAATTTDSTPAHDHSSGAGAEQISLPFRGFKCPSFLGSNSYLYFTSRSLTKTKLIVGIRHPILWFQSFWRMQGRDDPYERMGICPCKPNPTLYGQTWRCQNPYAADVDATSAPIDFDKISTDTRSSNSNSTNTTHFVNPTVSCRNECGGALFCVARGRFHLALAKLGKTALTNDELAWLSPEDPDGGEHVRDIVRHKPIENTVFFYEQTQLKEDPDFWDGLGNFLGVSHLPNEAYVGSKGKNQKENNLCDPYYDYFRATMMTKSYELSVWLQDYFLPVARDPSRTDLVVANDNVDLLQTIVEGYKADPCGRLIRDPASGTYVLDPAVTKATATGAASDSDSNVTTWTHATGGATAAALQEPLPPPKYRTMKKYRFLGGNDPIKPKKPTQPAKHEKKKKRRRQEENP